MRISKEISGVFSKKRQIYLGIVGVKMMFDGYFGNPTRDCCIVAGTMFIIPSNVPGLEWYILVLAARLQVYWPSSTIHHGD